MKKQLHFILMADVVASRQSAQGTLMKDFKSIVKTINKDADDKIASPLTITLGDEFQGVVKSLSGAMDVILKLEEEIIRAKVGIKLRYVLVEGEIDTPINRNIAHEMLGSGLTDAREKLNNLKNTSDRFHITLSQQGLTDALNDALLVFQGIIDSWDLEKDYTLITEFIKYKDYKLVAEHLKKDRSLMWRREKTTRIKAYLAIKNVINYLARP